MNAAYWAKVIAAFISCAYRPGLLGLPAEIFVFHFSFFETLIISTLAVITGSVLSAFLSVEIIKLWEYIFKPSAKKPKKLFRPYNRFLIKAKQNFGIVGMSVISPLILSIPVGVFLSIRFFKDRRKTVLFMSISSIGWIIALYFTYTKFYGYFMRYFQ